MASSNYEQVQNERVLNANTEFENKVILQNVNHETPIAPQIFKFCNPNCFICGGYNGPCFIDPTCSTCHTFSYANAAPEIQNMIILQEAGDGSDLEDDEERAPSTYTKNPIPPSINTESLPTEILIKIFKYLDDISLWSVSQVCKRWKIVLGTYIDAECWRNFTLLRWPLLSLTTNKQNWYGLYTALIQSCCCLKCLRQMAAQEFSTLEHDPVRKYHIKMELQTMRLEPLRIIHAIPLDSSYYHWQATIEGPCDTPYKDGIFFLYVQIPYAYPTFPPVVRFLTRIFHPNISRHGDIAIDRIHQGWSLDFTIRKTLFSIRSLLKNPNCDMCIEPEVGFLYLHNRQEFEEQARIWTLTYARHGFSEV